MKTITKETYECIDGVNVLIETIEIDVNEPTPEEIIAEKEAELLKIYAEIQALKTQQ